MSVAALGETTSQPKSKIDRIITATYVTGWIGLLATGALITLDHFDPSPEIRQAIWNVGLLTIGLKTVSLAGLVTLAVERKRRNKTSINAREPVEELVQLPQPRRSPFLIGTDEKPIEDTKHQTDSPLTTQQRAKSLVEIMRLAAPNSSSAVQALHEAQRLFPLATSITGIALTPDEKNIVVRFLKMLPVVSPDKHQTSDSMVSYFGELANLYARILNSYVHQVSVDLNDPAMSLRLEAIQRAILAERRVGHFGSVSVPVGVEVQASKLDQLKAERSLIDNQDAFLMAKLLVSVWFRALPEARTASTKAIIPLKREINNLLLQRRLSSKQREDLTLLLHVLNLPDNMHLVFDVSNVQSPELRSLITRIQESKKASDMFGLNRRDQTLRGRIQEAIKYEGIDILICAQDFEESSITIKSDDSPLTTVEETAISMALLFPGVKKIRIEMRNYQTLELPLDEFYLERIIRKNNRYLRSLLKTSKTAIAIN